MPSDSYTLIISDLGIPSSHGASHASGGTDAISISATQVTAGTLPVARGGTGVATSTGTGSSVLSTSPDLTTPNLGIPSAGILSSCTGLPISGLTPSTSTALGIGSIELGHATDTTVSRVSAGRLAVEGINIVTVSSTDTLTNKTLTSPVLTTPNLGIPSAGILSSCTDLPIDAGTVGVLPASRLPLPTTTEVGGVKRNVGTAGQIVSGIDSGGALVFVDALTGTGFAPAAGSTSIITLGTIATGVWNGTAISVAKGGTGATTASAAVTNLTTVESRGGSTITLVSGDSGKILRTTQTTPISVVIPTGLAANFSVMVIQGASGVITFSGGSAIQSFNTLLSTAGLYAAASVIQVATDTYNLSGNLA